MEIKLTLCSPNVLSRNPCVLIGLSMIPSNQRNVQPMERMCHVDADGIDRFLDYLYDRNDKDAFYGVLQSNIPATRRNLPSVRR